MSEIWSQNSGTRLGELNEGESSVIELPLRASAEITVISGSLPNGLEINNNQIVGTPLEVSRETEYRFVLRARRGSVIEDRTFNILVKGADEPEWVTEPGLLPVGKNNTFYILDNSPVDFQFEADDPDLAAGQQLRFFIASGDGELPPGINLSESGRLRGVVDPILALEKRAGDGSYDTSRYDRYPYDFALRQGGIYDSFFYDATITGLNPQEYAEETNQGYDSGLYDRFQEKTRIPKKLNRYYEFRVTISDGDTVSKRTFKIFVVGDDFLRADNTIMQVGTGIFTSDNTYLRTPFWLTPENLGFRRANNFITLFLEVLDTNTIPGTVTYFLEDTNPGTYIINETGKEVEGFYEISGEFPSDTKNNVVTNSEADFTVLEPETESTIPPGTEIDNISGEIFGRVPYQPAVTKEYRFTVNARRTTLGLTEIADSRKTFTVNLLGEIDSTIRWLTDPSLGTVPSNYVSVLNIKAESDVPNSFLLYNLESGQLPPGLTLSYTGEIFGKISSSNIEGDTDFDFTIKARDQFGFSEIQRTFSLRVSDEDDTVYSDIYYKPLLPQRDRFIFKNFVSDPDIFDPSVIYRLNDPRFGIQKDPKILVYAGLEESEIQSYVSATTKHASRKTLKIRDVKSAEAKFPGTNETIYEVVYLDLYDPYEKNANVQKKVKISNTEKILVNSIRRTNEFENNPINSLDVGTRFFEFNKIYFGNQLPIEIRSNSDNMKTVYWFLEYDSKIETRAGYLDPAYEFGSATNLVFNQTPENTITTDSNAIKISDSNDITRYIVNVSNFREELQTIGATERRFLPLWMRTAQTGSVQELGYTLAVPLVYCKPGASERILAGIRSSNIDLRRFEFDVDRLYIESSKESAQEQYIVFGNYQFNLA